MKKLYTFIISFLILTNLNAKNIVLKDVPYEFDSVKIQSAANAFHFLRSFVDYFYLLVNENKEQLPILKSNLKIAGWCAGDAHPENFGIIIGENNSRNFTINDWDDSGPCPVYLDIFRLLVSSKLNDPTLKTEDIVKAYKLGLAEGNFDPPRYIQALYDDSIKKGIKPSAKKVMANKIIRQVGMVEVDNELKDKIEKNIGYKILDIVETAKVGGGSGGLKRFEVLISENDLVVHLELKNEIQPAIESVKTADIANTAQRFSNSFNYFIGNNISHYYRVVTIDQKDYLLRPRFWGNVGVNLDEVNLSKDSDVILFEAFTLGKLHAKTIKEKVEVENLENINDEVDAFINHFKAKFDSLKR